MSEIIKTEEGDDLHRRDWNDQPFMLLLQITQSSGKPLPIVGFTGRAMAQMLHEVAGVVPKEVVIIGDQEVVVELEEEMSLMEVARAIHGVFHWGGQSIVVDSVVAKKDSIAEIIREREIGCENQKELKHGNCRMREDHQEHQQQTIEILEKVHDQVKKVENIHSGSMPALEGEYYTPPASHMRVSHSNKLSAVPPNLPIFWGQEPVPGTEGSIDQWLFQVEGALATHTEEAVRSAVIGSVRGAAHELLEFIACGEEIGVILRHIKEHFRQGPSKAKLQKEFFPYGAEKNRKH